MTDEGSTREVEALPEIVIRAPRTKEVFRLWEIYKFKGLLANMARRQVRLRYNDLALGMFWAVARPLMMVAVFVFIKNMSQARVGISMPYALYLYSGLILWFYFTEATLATANSIQANAGLIRKVYYPRLINPLVPPISGLADLLIGFVPLVGFMVYFGHYPGWKLVLLPFILMQCMALAIGIGCLFVALRLHSRDWERFLGLCLYVGLFVSPVIYSPAILPPNAQSIYNVNPMVGTLLAFRSTVFADVPFPIESFLYSCTFTLVVLLLGLYCFQRAEKFLLDQI